MRIRREDGTAAVEFVLVAPALILMLAAIVGAGRVVSTKSAVLDIARESARAAADAPDASTANAVAIARAREVATGHGLDPNRITIEQNPGNFGRGAAYVIDIVYRIELDDLPALGVLPGSLTVSAHHAELTDRYRSR